MKTKMILALFTAMILCMTAGVHADVIATFDGAAGSVDTYPGVAGDGWAGPWIPESHGSILYKTIKDPGDVNYPDIDGTKLMLIRPKATSDNGRGALSRDYSGTGGIDLAEDYMISFSIRPSEVSTMDGINDAYSVYGLGESSAWYTSAATFVLKGVGVKPDHDLEWYFFDGDNAGSVDSVYTGITIQEKHVYDVSIVMHPDTKTYDAYLTDVTAGSATFSVLGLGWRGSDHGTYLHFAAMAEDIDDRQILLFDNVLVTNDVLVPEPGTFVLLASLLVGLLIWRKR